MHFVCVVFGENVDEQLAPFHQYEATGHYDQYVKEVDTTQEEREWWQKYGVRDKVKLADGSVYHQRDSRFRLPRKGKSPLKELASYMSGDEYAYPEGSTLFKQQLTFREYVEEDEYHIFRIKDGAIQYPEGLEPGGVNANELFGFGIEDDNGEVIQVFRRTNPNARWDWYVIGGRWRDWLPLKPDASLANQIGALFRPEVGDRRWTSQARICDIDWAWLEDTARAEAQSHWAVAEPIVTRHQWKAKGEFVKGLKLDDAAYHTALSNYYKQRGLKRVRKALPWGWFPDTFLLGKDGYIERHVEVARSPHDYIQDGVWHTREGSDVYDEYKADWGKQFKAYRDSLDQNTLLTVIDYHI